MIATLKLENEKNRWMSILFDMVAVISAGICIGLFAPCKIYLSFTVVPLVLQGSVAILLGFLLGPRKGAMAVVAFLAQGAMNYPVFAGCNFGIAHILGPTGGYLLGYVLAAFYAGFCASHMKNITFSKVFSIILTCHVLVIIPGVYYLATFIGLSKAVTLGAAPFLIGDFIKSMVVTKLLMTWLLYREERESKC